MMFPSPMEVANALVDGFADGTLVTALISSFRRLLIGYAIALAIGTALGLLLAKSKLADQTLGSLILALQSIPSIVWLPMALLWFKIGDPAIIFVVVLGGTWTMTMNVRIGILNVQPLWIRAAQTMGYRGIFLFLRVMLPASVPYFITGSRLSWAFAWRALMAGELLGTGSGLGQVLMLGKDYGLMELVVAIMIIIGVIGSIMDYLVFQRIERQVLLRWGLQKSA